MKKILLSCACCLLALGLVTACEDEVIDDGGVEEGGVTTDEALYFGFNLSGVLTVIDGTVDPEHTYDGVLTTTLSEAVTVSVEEGSGSAYYISFEKDGVTNYITTVASGDYVNLSYTTTKSPIYLHTTDAGAEYFGDEDGSHFLSYYYSSLYCSDVKYIGTNEVAGVYKADGSLVLGGKEGTTSSSSGSSDGAPTLSEAAVPEGAYGIFDFSQLTITSTSSAWTNGTEVEDSKKVDGETYLAQAWKAADTGNTELPCSITSTTYTYAGAGGNSSQNDAYQLSLQCMKLSRGQTDRKEGEYEGSLVLDFGSTTISKVEVAALDWSSSEGATLKVAAPDSISSATAQSITGDASDASAEIATYTFDGLNSSSIELFASARVLVFSIAVYAAA